MPDCRPGSYAACIVKEKKDDGGVVVELIFIRYFPEYIVLILINHIKQILCDVRIKMLAHTSDYFLSDLCLGAGERI